MIFLLGLIACESDKLEPMLTGTLTAPHPDMGDMSGEFLGYKAFAFDDQGTFVTYISSNQAATCETVASYLTIESDNRDASSVLLAGHCNLFIKLTDYDDTAVFSAQDDAFASAGSSIECAMGEGSFQAEATETSWDGQWWLGIPKTYSWEFSGDKETEYTLEIDMSLFSGSFVLDEFDRKDATGNVSGVVTATVCSELAGTGYF